MTKLYPVQDLVGAINPTTGEIDFQTLVDTITGTVAPSSWDASGGAGSIEPFQIYKLLVVSQTQEIHREIKDLLTRLRAARKKNPPVVVAPSNEPVVRMYTLRLLSDEKENQQVIDMIRKLIEPKSWHDSNYVHRPCVRLDRRAANARGPSAYPEFAECAGTYARHEHAGSADTGAPDGQFFRTRRRWQWRGVLATLAFVHIVRGFLSSAGEEICLVREVLVFAYLRRW